MSTSAQPVPSTRETRVRILTEFAQVQALADDWERLHAVTPGATPWQSWPWLQAWWPVMGGDPRLCVVVVEQGGRPALILPLQMARVRMLGLSVRVLEPIGMPDEINRPLLALGPADPPLLRQALSALVTPRGLASESRSPPWDMLRVDEVLAEDERVQTALAFAREQGLASRLQPLHPCPYLSLKQSWPDFLASRGRRLGRNLRAAHRRLAIEGPVTVVTAMEAEAVDAAFARFLAVHERSWKHAAGIAFAGPEGYVQYYCRFLQTLAAEGRARVLTLFCGDNPVAAAIAVTDADTYYGAQIVHDQRYDRCSPGTVLEAMELEGLMAEGRYCRYDFFGAALSNKRRWTDHAHHTARLVLMRPTAVGRILAGYYFRLKPVIQRLRREPVRTPEARA
ncbi:GNAT family N-acetyltransferase [Aquisalimonas sp.]|uniref:GNAT family N-acetyltransferase n=1 Tax=Aquisalimonas sp. TaxID=1872621 RepID=UPI0025C647F5|nr:GNAT family N-acetyltransferase [Aquisalimonas sp.]